MFTINLVDSELTLAELAELLDMQPRTIRSYIERDLLRGPEVGGRGARYTDYHVTRLQAIRALKDFRGLPLAEVRRRLLSVTGRNSSLWPVRVPFRKRQVHYRTPSLLWTIYGA